MCYFENRRKLFTVCIIAYCFEKSFFMKILLSCITYPHMIKLIYTQTYRFDLLA